MEYDAFNTGVDPGGLISLKQIKLLVCYILKAVGKPIGKQNLTELLQYEGLANYFEVVKAIDELRDMGNILPVADCDEYVVSDTGRKIADELEDTLPYLVKEKGIRAAMKMMAKIKLMKENSVDISKSDGGYLVVCRSFDGERTLLSIELLLPDKHQAESVKRTFLDDPVKVYSGSIALLTGDYDAVKTQFEDK